jgi:UDP-glucuronate decarboxylase
MAIRELAELVLAGTGSSSKPVNLSPRDDPRQRRPDTSLAKAELGWQPTVRLQDGLRPTVAFFRRDQARRSRNPEEPHLVAVSA